MILDAGFEMNELITISALQQLPPSPCLSSPTPPPHRCTPPTHLMSQISSSISNDISQFQNLKETWGLCEPPLATPPACSPNDMKK